MTGRLTRKRHEAATRGAAILVVIPILLFVVLIALFMIQIIQSKLQSATLLTEAIQAKYLARSATQLARLEIQRRTELASHTRHGGRTIRVRDSDGFPARGRLYLAEHNPGVVFSYSREGSTLTLDRGISQNLPKGTSVYLCRDLDGDGTVGTVGPMPLGTGEIQVTRADVERGLIDSDTFGPTLYLRAKARVGVAESVLETAVVLR